MIVTAGMRGIRFYSFVFLFALAACSESKPPESNQNTTPSTSIPLSNTPNKDSQKDTKDPGQKDPGKSPGDKGPCCHNSANLMFRAIEAQGKLSGLSSDLHPLKTYKGNLLIEDGVGNLDGSKLRVRASMENMDHGEIEFNTKQIKQDEFQIDGVVFTMPGEWDIAFQFLDAAGEVLDACKCKLDIKK